MKAESSSRIANSETADLTGKAPEGENYAFNSNASSALKTAGSVPGAEGTVSAEGEGKQPVSIQEAASSAAEAKEEPTSLNRKQLAPSKAHGNNFNN